jgi:hypothetical protein
VSKTPKAMKPELQNLYELLTAYDEANIWLALNDLPNYEPLEEVFFAPLLCYAFLPNRPLDEAIMQKSKELFEKNAPETLKKSATKLIKNSGSGYRTEENREALKEIIANPHIQDKLFFFEKTSDYDSGYAVHCLENNDEIREIDFTFNISVSGIAIQNLDTLLRKLPKATYINAQNCSIKNFGENIPENQTLTSLVLTNCGVLSLPENINNLKRLTTLDVRGNSLQRLPESIGTLKHLIHFFAANNQLTEIPESFRNLKRPEVLDFSNNLLMTLPDSLLELQWSEPIPADDTWQSAFQNTFVGMMLTGNPIPETEKTRIKEAFKSQSHVAIIF